VNLTQPHPTTPEHRAEILAELGEVWAKCPHLRFGQLIANAVPQPYFVPDARLVDLFRFYYAKLTPEEGGRPWT